MEIVHRVEFKGRDQLTLWKSDDGRHFLKAQGCSELQDAIRDYRARFGDDLRQWTIDVPKGHADFLIKKLLFLIAGKKHPYPDLELCHCRSVPTQTVEDAIFNGVADIETIRRQTSASTSCGTCGPDIEGIFNHWNSKAG